MASKKLTELQKSSSPSGKRIPIEGSGQVMEYTTPEDILDTPHTIPVKNIPTIPATKVSGLDDIIRGKISEANDNLVDDIDDLKNNKGALWDKDKITAPTDFDATDNGGEFLSKDNTWSTPSISQLSQKATAGEDLGEQGELTPVFFGTGGETITDGQSATVGETSTQTTFTLPTSSVSPYVREILVTKTETGNPDDIYYENSNSRRLLPTDFTTYTKDGWTLGANSEYNDTPARKARNGDTSDSWGSFWSTDFNNLTVSESTPAIFTIQAPNKKIFEKVKVRWRKNNSTDNRAVDTEIFGVNNGERTSLGARTGQNEPASAVEREYILSNNSEGFTSLEIKITRASSSGQIIINDIDVYGSDYVKQLSIPNGQSIVKVNDTVTDVTFTGSGSSPSNYSTITIDEVRYGFDADKVYTSDSSVDARSYFDGVVKGVANEGDQVLVTTHGRIVAPNIPNGKVLILDGKIGKGYSDLYAGVVRGGYLYIKDELGPEIEYSLVGGGDIRYYEGDEISHQIGYDGNKKFKTFVIDAKIGGNILVEFMGKSSSTSGRCSLNVKKSHDDLGKITFSDGLNDKHYHKASLTIPVEIGENVFDIIGYFWSSSGTLYMKELKISFQEKKIVQAAHFSLG